MTVQTHLVGARNKNCLGLFAWSTPQPREGLMMHPPREAPAETKTKKRNFAKKVLLVQPLI